MSVKNDFSMKMEELVGLEPTHTGFAIRGITSFAIAPMLDKPLTMIKVNDLF